MFAVRGIGSALVASLAAIASASVLAGGAHVVSQKDKKFSVAALTVKAGDAVTFKNDDGIIHNVFSTSKGAEFNLNAQKPGTSNEHVFAGEGVVDVRCAFHPTMKLTVTVTK